MRLPQANVPVWHGSGASYGWLDPHWVQWAISPSTTFPSQPQSGPSGGPSQVKPNWQMPLAPLAQEPGEKMQASLFLQGLSVVHESSPPVPPPPPVPLP